MSTNREVVTKALQMLGVIRADETPANEDAELALTELNDLMADLAAEGIDAGFPPQDSLSDDFPLDDATEAAVKPQLAVRLFTHFPSAKFPQTLPARSEAAFKRMLRDSVLASMVETSVSHLPGSQGHWNIETDE